MTEASATDVLDVSVPSFVTITDVTQPGAAEPEYVISNEATGRYFLANRVTVQFFEALRQTGSLPQALASAAIDQERAKVLIQQLLDQGVLTKPGQTNAKPQIAQAPIEGKLISIRWDLVDSSAVAARLNGVGRFLFGPLGYFVWLIAMGVMLFQLLINREKVTLTLAQIFDASLTQWLIFAGLFIVLKIIHEMGHALAYQEMCRQEDLSPGPIRMGICIFALSPFPFTDVTGAWRIKSRFRRIMIGAGGIYIETWVMAALTVFWAQTQAGLLQTVILQVAVIAGAMALLFNLNPAVKLDGYFMLTDYLRRPNLAGRASVAARIVFARMLGATAAPPNRGDLLYWGLSYLYRWTIFAGIFWLVYQFDKRLAPIVLVGVAMMLVVRPLLASLRFARHLGMKPLKSALTLVGFGAVAVMIFVPLPYWQTVSAQMMRYETRFVEPTETGVLRKEDGARFRLDTPALTQQIRDVELRQDMLENLKRARFASAQEQARLTGEIARFEETRLALDQRRETLMARPGKDAVWTAMDSRWLEGSWVTPGRRTRLAAVSDPVPAYVRLRLEQSSLNSSVALANGTALRLRPRSLPDCTFGATLQVEPSSLLAVNGVIVLHAKPDNALPACAADLPHGTSLAVRLPAQDQSIVQRVQLTFARMLQDRLPVNMNEEQR